MSLLETKVVFKAHERVTRRNDISTGRPEVEVQMREYTREVTITGKNMDDINHQAEKVAAYLKEQTGMTWVIEVSDYKDIEI